MMSHHLQNPETIEKDGDVQPIECNLFDAINGSQLTCETYFTHEHSKFVGGTSFSGVSLMQREYEEENKDEIDHGVLGTMPRNMFARAGCSEHDLKTRDLKEILHPQPSPSNLDIELATCSFWANNEQDGHTSIMDASGEMARYDESMESSLKHQFPYGNNPTGSRVELHNNKQKRRRSRPCKTSEEVESQRMTHIAVERNRRKQMNEHLRVLRSLMPGSYVQRGDQASIIGGAIEFVKELQQLLHCLEEQKRRKMLSETLTPRNGCSVINPQNVPCFPSTQVDSKYIDAYYEPIKETYAEIKSDIVDVEVKMLGADVFIKILSHRNPGQLLKTIIALENVYCTILHTNITTIEHTVLYSFNIKVEANCGLTVEKIASIIQQSFSTIET